MTKNELTENLQQHFGGAGMALIESIHKWLAMESFTGDEIEDLYRAVIGNHDKYYPSLKQIKDYYFRHVSRRRGGYVTKDTVLNHCHGWTFDRIMRVYLWVMQKQERNSFECHYIATFQPLYYKYTTDIEKYGVKNANEYGAERLEKMYKGMELDFDYAEPTEKVIKNLNKRNKEEKPVKEIMEEMF